MVKGIDRPMQATSWQSPKRLKKKRETSSSIAYSLYVRCCCTEFLAQSHLHQEKGDGDGDDRYGYGGVGGDDGGDDHSGGGGDDEMVTRRGLVTMETVAVVIHV